MMKKLLSMLGVIGLMAFTPTVSAHAASVDEIVKKANHAAYYQGKDGRAKVHMTIKDKQGRERTRDFVILRKDIEDASDGKQKFYVYFKRPADVNKTAFMVWKNVGGDDDRWLYLPALDLVKRIAASDERTSFVGSHFFYEDVSGRNPSEDNHKLVEETSNYYVLESKPKKSSAVEFKSYKSWIHKTTFIPIKVEFKDKGGKVYRVIEATKVDTISGHPTVTESKVRDDRIGGTTTMKYTDVKYNSGVPEDIFTERYLRTPPRAQLR